MPLLRANARPESRALLAQKLEKRLIGRKLFQEGTGRLPRLRGAKKSGTALPPLPGLDSSAVTRAGFRVSRRLPTLASRPVVVAAPRQIEPDSELAKLRELAALKAQVSKRRGARAVELLLAHLWRWCCGGTRSNGGGW